MSFPQMPPVNVIRQLKMFEDYIPHRARFWSIVMFAIFYQFVGGVYIASLAQMVGELSWLSEDVNMAMYCALIGLNMIFPMLFRWKFGLYTRQLFFIASAMVIVCSIAATYVTIPEVMWVICLIAGYFKMLGMFGCMSTIQLCLTPTRNFAVFLPVIYVLVSGSVQLSGFMAAYVTYYFNWRMMNIVIVVMMLIIEAITYFCMKHDHRSGPPIPLKGIDWVGQVLWIVLCMVGAWIFTFGEHYDWWDSIEIWRATWIFIALLIIVLAYSAYKKEAAYIDLKAFAYPQTWTVILILLGFAIMSGSIHVLQPIYLTSILNYDILNEVTLNIPEFFGIIMGAILGYFVLIRWRYGVKHYMFLTFFMATYYVLSMYFICDTATDKETMYLAVFAFGMAEVMADTIATYYLSQTIPFKHFFMNLTIIGFVRCGVGTAAGAAIVQRLFHWSCSKNMMVASESLSLNNVSDTVMTYFSQQGMLMALKESYGWLIFVGVIMLTFILLSNYRTTIMHFVPRMVAVSRWMTHAGTKDPTT
jgi:hypothetical protein